MAIKIRTFKPEPFPTPEEQQAVIDLHDGVLKRTLQNTFQILTPPPIRGQFPEIRVMLTRSPQTVFFNIPRASKFFLMDQLLIHYPTDTENELQGPILNFGIDGIDQLLVEKRRPVDARLFTSPNVDPDPSTTGDNSSYKSGLNFNYLIRNQGFLKIIVTGFDGTNPEWVDMVLTGRNIMNRRAMNRF